MLLGAGKRAANTSEAWLHDEPSTWHVEDVVAGDRGIVWKKCGGG